MLKHSLLFRILGASLVASSVWAAPEEPVDCSAIKTSNYSFNGRTYQKPVITNPAQFKCLSAQPTAEWVVKKNRWEWNDESEFQKFITVMGQSSCNTVDSCMSTTANILRAEIDMVANHYSDCADFPYYLRAYFAWKKNLPMVVTTEIKAHPLTAEQQVKVDKDREVLAAQSAEKLALFEKNLNDLRYSRNGNFPVRKLVVPSDSKASKDFFNVASTIRNMVSSGNMRTQFAGPSGLQSDFYSPQVTTTSIGPGTVLYNTSGHVAIVYEVTAQGEVKFMDAHPDNSISRGSFNVDYKTGSAWTGGNFKSWRPFAITNPEKANSIFGNGGIKKGTLVEYRDEQLPDASLEQYSGNMGTSTAAWSERVLNQNLQMSFHEWVLFRLSNGSFRIDPMAEMGKLMDQLCLDLKARVEAVNVAVLAGIHKKSHPANLPSNIYGADGEWESYSSPGRDIRLRNKVLSIQKAAKEWMTMQKESYPLLNYYGANLKADVLLSYEKGVKRCELSYLNSRGNSVPLNVDQVLRSLTDLSYDPYSCPERRWGAKTPEALASCADDEEKAEWHRLQQFLRNKVEKDSTAVHGYALEDLRNMEQQGGVQNLSTSEKYYLFHLLNQI